MLVYECVMIMLMLCKSIYARLTPEVLHASTSSSTFDRAFRSDSRAFRADSRAFHSDSRAFRSDSRVSKDFWSAASVFAKDFRSPTSIFAW